MKYQKNNKKPTNKQPNNKMASYFEWKRRTRLANQPLLKEGKLPLALPLLTPISEEKDDNPSSDS